MSNVVVRTRASPVPPERLDEVEAIMVTAEDESLSASSTSPARSPSTPA